MRFYNQQHGFYCGVDLHARMLALCILDDQGRIVFEGKLAAGPEAFRQAIAPFRTLPSTSPSKLVVACECMFAWYWLADWCQEEKIPFVLGHALYLKAIPDQRDGGPHAEPATNSDTPSGVSPLFERPAWGTEEFLGRSCPSFS